MVIQTDSLYYKELQFVIRRREERVPQRRRTYVSVLRIWAVHIMNPSRLLYGGARSFVSTNHVLCNMKAGLCKELKVFEREQEVFYRKSETCPGTLEQVARMQEHSHEAK